MDAARGGDDRALSELYRLFAPVLHGILHSYVSHAEADDLVQEVFETALRHLQELKSSEAFPAWIVAIARRRALNALRKRSAEALVDMEYSDLRQSPEDRAAAQQALLAICSLAPVYREPLMLRLVEGLTGPEIAARTGMTEGSIRVNLHRGMRKLRAALGIEASAISK